MITQAVSAPSWIERLSEWLTPRRIRAHALVLAVCLWGVCAFDYSKPGLFDRAGNIKFQDFLQFPVEARLIAEGRSNVLYNDQVLAEGIRQIVGKNGIELHYYYGPQVALPFVPLASLSFLSAASIWMAVSVVIYFACVYLITRSCGGISAQMKLISLCAIAYPPFFHFFVRGHLSAVSLLLVTLSYLALRRKHEWWAGLALGCLVFKPQFLVAIPIILLLAGAWRILIGLALSAAAQLAFAYAYFGKAVMQSYIAMLLHSAGNPASTELRLSAIQMHSLRSFWELLIPWPHGVTIAYVICSPIVIVAATGIWKSSRSLAIRFSALLVAAVLVNPHIYIYDLLALAPVLLIMANWSIENAQHGAKAEMRVLLYLAFMLPLFGPVVRWTHLQLSVIVFAALLWVLHRITTADRKLALAESAVV
ncbi:MAG TPA: glycosyltransferase family 87 protein [Candidatus Sulfotelmatobacter sp.]|nr:glycosyltransferase family 87 protein [Candidatus Sulfotelmatobacter sp.]